MIAVIADDFTGAAELAGIALRYCLSVQLFTNDVEVSNADVIVVSTDSRSLNKAAAIQATQQAVKSLLLLNPTSIYKKTDSVLRGYVIDELREQMSLQQLHHALLLPANPSLGRTIVDGKYYINHQLINETSFASDPEFSITNALVKSIVKAENDDEVVIAKHTDDLPQKQIVIGEVASKNDIECWLKKVNSNYLIAGAGDCFEALLLSMNYQPMTNQSFELQQPHLYVSGTSFNKSVELIKEISKHGCVHYLSTNIMLQTEDEVWYLRVMASIKQHKKVVLAIDEVVRKAIHISAVALREAMAKAVKKIIEQNNIHEVLIEGGSTAAAILTEMNVKQFTPTNELSRGVIRMKSNDLFITVKPGSYELAPQIKQLYQV